LASIQRIIKTAGIPRGSFYQYFKDKADLYLEILRMITDRKIQYLTPALKHWQSLGFFEFLHLALKLGFEFTRDYPGYLKIGEDLVSSKTFSIENVREALIEHFQDYADIGTVEFYKRLVEHAVETGELKSNISAETAALFTKSVLDSMNSLVLSHQFADPLGKEMENLFGEFISIIRDGLAATND
jgi:AcrR family transcriptional regulator